MITRRKKRLRIIQLTLFILGLSIIIYTYKISKNTNDQIVINQSAQELNEELAKYGDNIDVFENIEYSGLDFSGNRYILRSKKAYSDRVNKEYVDMEGVKAIFYFKDGTELNIFAEKGLYNNKTLDMEFYVNVEAIYQGSKLYAQKAEYSNKNNFLKISENVIVNDAKGSLYAEELLFDIKNQNLNIKSKKNGKINTNLNLKWKKDLEY